MTQQRLDRLPARAAPDLLRAIIESPRGARVKMQYEPELGVFRIKRALPTGLAYPFDWGFIAGTQAPDGDPVDVMVMGEQVSYPGTLIEVRPLAMLEIEERPDDGNIRCNPRIIAAPSWLDVDAARALLDHLREDVCEFLVRVGEASAKTIVRKRWRSASAASRYVDEHLVT